MIAEQYPGLLERPDAEKIQLANELLVHLSIGSDGEVSAALAELLEERLGDYRRNPGDAVPWEAVKQKILSASSSPRCA